MTVSDTTSIAIIGMAGRFPGARDTQSFWRNIAAGVKSLRAFSDEELLAAGVAPELLREPGYVKVGAILDDIEQFDAAFFGFAPRDAETMDPQHRFFLECAWEALEDAAYDPAVYQGLIGVFAGSGFSTYLINNLYQNPELEDIADPLLSAVGNERDALASTVSYKFNLKGPAISAHTFCSTSLVAVHLACQSLLNYECDLALAGGVAIQVPHLSGYLYKEGGIVSPDGECRAFDANAQGSVVGNGIGVVTLKRFSEALEDGDQIYAVIRGSAVNNDGSVRVSYTAPGLDGQAAVVAEAMGAAGVIAEDISYIEAHGTGTVLGDSVELAAMKKAFALSTSKQQFCAIGSAKPNVGHLDRASGVTGLIKATLALKNKVVPPSINFEQANPEVDLEHSPFYVNIQAHSWETQPEVPRRAGVNSFGLGGTNAHVVLEEAPEREPASEGRPYQLLLLSAKTENALEMATQQLAEHLQQHEDISLADVAYTLQVGRSAFNHRRILICRDRGEAIQALQGPAEARRIATRHQTYHNRTTAFLFPGVGEQYEGMAKELYQAEPSFRETIDHCCAWLKTHMEMDLLPFLCPEEQKSVSSGRRGPGRRNNVVASAQATNSSTDGILAEPATFVLEYALAQLLGSWGIQPRIMLGYGVGEYVAACMAGVLSLEDALTLVAQRARLLAQQTRGALVTVGLSAESVEPYLDEQVSLAAVNGPRLCVLAGPLEAIEMLEEQFSQQGIEYQRVATDHAYYAALLEPLRTSLDTLTRNISSQPPQIPYISNVTGIRVTDEQATDHTYWLQHTAQTSQFAEGIANFLREGEHLLLEVGPGQTIGSLIQRHPACNDRQASLVYSTLPSSSDPQSTYAYLLQTLGALWLEGIAPAWSGFYAHERRYRLSLPTYPFERRRYWIDPPRRTLAPAAVPETKGKHEDRGRWFYQPVWEASPLPSGQPSQGPWLIFEDEGEPGERIAQRLYASGETVIRVKAGPRFTQMGSDRFSIRPHEQGDYDALCEALEKQDQLPGTILHLWNITAEREYSDSPTAFQHLQNYGLYSLIYLAQALGARVYDTSIRLMILSSGLQEVTGQERLIPEKATLLGACKVIPQEYLNITCHSIDIDINEAIDDSLLDSLLAESRSENSDYIVAYRGGTRWSLNYQPLYLNAIEEKHAPFVFRRQGVYLITGGLGGIGLVLAHYLARTVQARLVLLGHSAFPPREEWKNWSATHDANDLTHLRIEHIQAIEALGGQVHILRADVSDCQQLRQAIDQAYQRFGALHGVIHAAGVSSEAAFRTIQEIGPEQCEMHFKPKVYGLYALEQALAGHQLDFCLHFSSLSAVLGGLGFSGYTAANCFIDAFVRQHNREATTAWTCVNWDTWLIREDAHGSLGGTVAEFAMRPEEGSEAFLRVIAQRGISHLVNSTGNLQARINQWIKLEKDRPAETESSQQGRPYLSTEYVAPQDEYEQRVVEIWQQVLGIQQIGIQDNFFELGGHSLMGTQLVSRLRKAFQMEIPLGTLFEAPTVEELTTAIKLLLLEEIEKLDEKEVMRLI